MWTFIIISSHPINTARIQNAKHLYGLVIVAARTEGF